MLQLDAAGHLAVRHGVCRMFPGDPLVTSSICIHSEVDAPVLELKCRAKKSTAPWLQGILQYRNKHIALWRTFECVRSV